MKGTTAITTMLPSTKCLPVLEGGIRTQILFIKLGWNIYGRIFLRRANDTVMDGNLALQEIFANDMSDKGLIYKIPDVKN